MRTLNVAALSAASYLATSLLTSDVQAQTFQTEVALGYSSLASDLNTVAAGAEYYFNPVSLEGRPWAEAAFLQREAGVYGYWANQDLDGEIDISLLALGGEYFATSLNLYLAVTAMRSEVEIDFFDVSETENSVDFTLGFSPMAGLLVTTTYNNEVDYELNISTKYVKVLDGGQAYNFEVNYYSAPDDEFDDLDDGLELEFDYYLDPTFSIGLLLNNTAGGYVNYDVGENAIGLRIGKFFSEAFGVRAEYQTIDDESIWSLEGALRF